MPTKSAPADAPRTGETSLKTAKSLVPPPAFDPQRYPRTYTFSASGRGTMVVGAAGLLTFIGWLIAVRSTTSTRSDLATGIFAFGAFAALATWIAAAGLRTRAILSEDGLEYRGAFLSRSVRVADILGRRCPYAQAIQFELRPGRGRRLRMRGDLARDEWFESWLARIPDLDAAERAASLARVLEDTTLGATPDDVAVRLRRAVLLGRVGAAIAFALLLELQVAPAWWTTQSDIAIAVALGFAALLSAVLLRGLVTLVPTRNDARPSALPMIAAPMLVLPLRVWTQFNLHDGRMLTIGAVALTLLGAWTALPMASSPRRRALATLGACACVVAFVGTGIAWLDVWLDRRPVQPVRVAVTARDIGKGPARRIGVAQANGAPPERVLFVSRADYKALQVGDIACLSEHPGLLGLRWAEVHACADATDRAGAI